MKNGENAELLIIDGKRLTRGLLDGTRTSLPQYRSTPPEYD